MSEKPLPVSLISYPEIEEIRTFRRSVRFSETSEQLRQDFDSLRVTSTKEFDKLRKEMKDIFEEAMANIQRKFEERLSTIDISTNLIATSSDTINDILPINATTTGTISTILPLPSSVANTNLTFNFNNNDDTEFLTYEEEAYDSISYDDLLLSNEDQAFVDSIQNPTFSGICLSSPTDYSSLSFPTISGLDESAAVPEVLTIISQESTSCTSYLIVIASYLLVDYIFKLELIIYINYQYRIFFWDPGIFLSYVQQ